MSGTEQQRDAYDVSDREEPAREAQVCRHLDAALVSGDADANHRDENGTCALHMHQPRTPHIGLRTGRKTYSQ